MKLQKHYDFRTMNQLDENDWNIEVGEKWANNEKQHYVDDKENLYLDKEKGLVIKATYKDGIYKSARINTRHKFAFRYGRIDIVAKVPSGKGTWPALWMMPEEARFGRWPRSGEIDIMEHVGNERNKLYLCLHTEKYNHKFDEYYYTTITQDNIVDAYHTYSLLWEDGKITYFLDHEQVAQYERGEEGKDASPAGWPFDEQFYLIINMAIGGALGGKIDDACFPQEFVVQDIKIYQE